MLISTYFKENAQSARAEVLRNEAGEYYYIDYYDAGGNKFYTETFPGKSVYYVEDAAENWAQNLKVLQG
jgi:hypothetical protein